MKKQCIQDMLALIMAALVHFGAWNNMVPGLVWLGETIGAFEKNGHVPPFKAMCSMCLAHARSWTPLRLYMGSQQQLPRVLLSLHLHHTQSLMFPCIQLSVVALGYTKMAVVEGVPALRVAIWQCQLHCSHRCHRRLSLVAKMTRKPVNMLLCV